jgi:hypothetical protein
MPWRYGVARHCRYTALATPSCVKLADVTDPAIALTDPDLHRSAPRSRLYAPNRCAQTLSIAWQQHWFP